ncbi:MAG TPA: hypothetical protein VEW74_05705, partial [Candidatus Nitrosotalea sp.]|nr:hypothetical protein [Candidatus Nitrosotalea sp.]
MLELARRHYSRPVPSIAGVLLALLVSACAGPGGPSSSAALPGVVSSDVRPASLARGATLPSQLLFVPTGSEAINVYALKNANQQGP